MELAQVSPILIEPLPGEGADADGTQPGDFGIGPAPGGADTMAEAPAGWAGAICRSDTFWSTRFGWPNGTDFNADGLFTITDLWHMTGWLYHAPADALLLLMIDNGMDSTDFGRFLELSCASIGGGLSAILSGAAWLLLANIVQSLFDWD